MPPRRRGSAALLALAASLSLLPAARPAAAEGGEAGGAPAGRADEEEKEWFRRDVAVFEPFERSRPRGSTVRLQLRLWGSYRAPVLVVVFPDGDARYFRPADSAGDRHEFEFRLDRRGGRHRVSLAAESAGGVLYGARFFLEAVGADGKPVDRDIDLPPADTVYPALDPEEHPLRLERFLFHRMNALRARQRLAPLPWHEGVARAARDRLPDIARHYEETVNPRTGFGRVVHRIPGAGPGGAPGPSVADRVAGMLGWARVLPYLPPEAPERGRDRPDYVTESVTEPSASLDEKFEQVLLRKSDLRAPMLSPWLTHAAGAATWRWYGWKAGDAARPDPPREPGPAPAGRAREAMALLVFVQANGPAAEEAFRRERAEVEAALSRASKAPERAEALRRFGQQALPDAPRLLREAARARDPAVRAAALDGLWLCAPGDARAIAEPLRIRVLQSLEAREEAGAAEAVRVLGLCRYDAPSRREGERAAREVAARAREALDAAAGAAAEGRRDEARGLFEAARRRFAGFPEIEEEAASALRSLPPPPAEPR